ncbi:hypothetical protein [Nocardioides pacificus]
MDDATWLALAAVLTALGAAWTVYAWRHRGVASALRGAGLTLLAPAAFLTDTLELIGDVGLAVGDWATGLVLSPVVWLGISLAGLSVVLFVVSGILRERGYGVTPRGAAAGGQAAPGQVPGAAERRAVPPAPAGRGEPAIDDDLADIEALLRKRGIN